MAAVGAVEAAGQAWRVDRFAIVRGRVSRIGHGLICWLIDQHWPQWYRNCRHRAV